LELHERPSYFFRTRIEFAKKNAAILLVPFKSAYNANLQQRAKKNTSKIKFQKYP
jgi:hypothetical protein